MGLLDDAIREHLELKRRRGADSAEISAQEREILGAGGAAAEPAAEALGGELPLQEPPATPGFDDAPLADEPMFAEPAAGGEGDDPLFPHTHELIEAGAAPAEPAQPPAAEPAAEAPPAAAAPPPPPAATTPSLQKSPEPAPAAADAAERTGARRLSDEELAAWRKRLSERADRLAAQRAGTDQAPPASAAASPSPAAPTPQPAPEQAPPSVWSARKPEPPAATPPAPGVPVDFFDAGEAERAFAPEPAPEPQADADHDVLDETPDFLQETPEHDRMWFEQRPPRDFDFG